MEQTIDKRDFVWFCDFLRAESAISIDDSKEYLVATRIAPLLRENDLPSFEHLVQRLKRSPRTAIHQKVVEAMTTNETSFFRDLHPFDTLEKHVLPELAARRGDEGVNIWCAASSTGQEPYTIAMVLSDKFPELARRSRILCTDINQVVLDRTKVGAYSQLEVNRGLPASMLIKYFDRKGSEWHVKESLRRMIDTRILNLAAPWNGVPIMDVVFIRNVLIYFDTEVKKAIVGRIRRNLAMDGALFVGGAETLLNIDSDFTRVVAGKSTIYRRTA